MKQLKYYFVTLLFCSSLSCNKSFLDVEDNTFLLREQYVNNLNSLQQYLNGIYIVLGQNLNEALNGHRIMSELTADNIKPSLRNPSYLISHYTWNQSNGTRSGSPNGGDELWKNSYQFIRNCSFVIEKAKDFKNEDPIKANQIAGEAYSLRALAHFILVNTFAQSYNFTTNASHLGVPYITSWDWNTPFHRNTVKEVYDGMIDDLNKAIPLLTPNNNNKIIMNQLAAKALLARIYLFKEEWQKAKDFAVEVCMAVPLMINSPTNHKYPDSLFRKGETEALFQIEPSSTNVVNGSYTTIFEGSYFRGTLTLFIATDDITTLLNQGSGDVRRKWISTSLDGIDSIRKFPSNVVSGFGSANNLHRSYYITVIRSSEMFLTVAEASAHLGDALTSKNFLDAIRQRADPAAANSTATGLALLDSIYIERRKELAFEGLRMWDLLRWKKGVSRMDAISSAPRSLPYPSNKAITPIPLSDVNYGIQQNPSY
jgi:hypothetical protein